MSRVYVAAFGKELEIAGAVQFDGKLYQYVIDWDTHPFTGKRSKSYIVADGDQLRLLVTEKHVMRFMAAEECIATHEQLRIANKPMPDIAMILAYIKPR